MLLSSMAGVSDNGQFGGGSFLDNPETVQTLERLGNGSFPIGAVDVGPVSSREEFVQRINSGRWGQPKLSAARGDVTVPDSARLGAYYGVDTAAPPSPERCSTSSPTASHGFPEHSAICRRAGAWTKRPRPPRV